MAFSYPVIQQANLLLDILPLVAQEKCFALHGGTALNYFILDMPRLSVDIDLTYIPIEPNAVTIRHINQALTRIAQNITSTYPHLKIFKRYASSKIKILQGPISVKIEPNRRMRGTIRSPEIQVLTPKTAQFFKKQVSMPLVPKEQIIGGKFCAALSRKMKRDLFDVREIIHQIPFTESIKEGFFYAMLSHYNKILNHFLIPIEFRQNPTRKEVEGIMKTMLTDREHQKILNDLLEVVHQWLTPQDKEFLLEFQKGHRNYRDYSWLHHPSIEVKIKNLQILQKTNPLKWQNEYQALKDVLDEPKTIIKSLWEYER